MKHVNLFLYALLISATSFAGNLLKNSNMETKGDWQISYLNTPDAQKPNAIWGSSTLLPTAGSGNALYVTGAALANSGANSQIAFYQQVTLSADSVYAFDAAFKYSKLEQAWCEAFIGQMPVAGQDYSDALGTKIANFGSWDNPLPVNDGTFKLNAKTNTFSPTTSGNYYFIIKMGATTWDATTQNIAIAIDELTLIGTKKETVTPLQGGGLLRNGNMESQGAWVINNLNSTVQPTLTWGSATIKPTAGTGNALYVNSSVTNVTANVAIYQPVTLSSDSTYEFNAAYKYSKLEQAWCEAYIGGSAPVTGSDYDAAKGTLVGKFGGWDVPSATDGTYLINAPIKSTFKPATTGTYYFVLKLGNMSWDTSTKLLEIAIDEISLRALKLSGLNDATNQHFTISVKNGYLKIDGIQNNVTIYNSNGQQIQAHTLFGTFESNKLNNGIYIVSVDGIYQKVLVR